MHFSILCSFYLGLRNDAASLFIVWGITEFYKRNAVFLHRVSPYSRVFTLCKIYENTGFRWPVFFCKKTESNLLSLNSKKRANESPSTRMFYTVLVTYHIVNWSSSWIKILLTKIVATTIHKIFETNSFHVK